ncbi:MAG: serine hydrolase [Candidatus Omnitrophica bacterium]|nr:serine hydrolase [Candidatus Omnitrophota bacterium]
MKILKDNKAILPFLVISAIFFISLSCVDLQKKIRWRSLRNTLTEEAAKFSGDPSIVIKDLKRGWIINLDENIKLPSASLVKVPIMASCFYAAANGKLDLNSRVLLEARHKAGGSGEIEGKPNGTAFTIEELIDLMIIQSDNTATNMLIDLLGFDYLNACFKKFGLEDTNISRMMMDMKSRRMGIENYTTARDMALVFEKIYTGHLINRKVSLRCLNILKQQKMQDRIPARLPDDIAVAHKTGLEKGICHDVGIVFTNNGDFLICALTKHHDKSARRAKRLISKIAFLTYNSYTK